MANHEGARQDLPPGAVRLDDGEVLEAPQGMKGVDFVFGGWSKMGQRKGQIFIEKTADAAFLHSAALDSIPGREDEDTSTLKIRKNIRDSEWLPLIVKNPHCSPELILAIVQQMNLGSTASETDKMAAAMGSVDTSDFSLREKIISNERTPLEALRLLANEKNTLILGNFLDCLYVPSGSTARKEFFQYLCERADTEDDVVKMGIYFYLLKGEFTPKDIVEHIVDDLDSRLDTEEGRVMLSQTHFLIYNLREKALRNSHIPADRVEVLRNKLKTLVPTRKR